MMLRRADKWLQYAESDVDSGAAETVVLSSAESEVEPVGTLEPSGVWSSGRYSSVRVTATNPLLRSTSSSSKAASAPASRPAHHTLPIANTTFLCTYI